jgi:hypothetical protein
MCCFPKTAAGLPHYHIGLVGSALHSTPSSGGEIYHLFIRLPVSSSRGAMCPQVALDYVVPSRADDVRGL